VEGRVGRGRRALRRQIALKTLDADEGYRQAKTLLGQMAQGRDPAGERRAAAGKAANSLKAICEAFLARKGGMERRADDTVTFKDTRELRSAPRILEDFERLVYPETIANQSIDAIKRRQLNDLFDKVEDRRGAVMADRLRAYLSSVFNWHAARDDNFASPFVRRMARTKPRERARDRALTDEEIRDVWAATDASGEDMPACFGRLVRTLLLTAMRRTEAARMSWSEIEHVRRDDLEGDVWTCPGSRMKGKRDHAVPLTPTVCAIIGERPANATKRTFIFSTDGGKRAFSGYSKAKRALDDKISELRKADGREPMSQWRLHDLRRTAKTLMQRGGVRPDISERVLAHTIRGVHYYGLLRPCAPLRYSRTIVTSIWPKSAMPFSGLPRWLSASSNPSLTSSHCPIGKPRPAKV
jgi:integrase